MDKFLITGFSGFVGHHFLEYLYQNNIQCEVIGIDIIEPKFDLYQFHRILKITYKKIDMLDINDLKKCLSENKPDYILHLASFSSVAYSWQHPTESFTNNTNIFLNLITVVRDLALKCRILSIGSSEEYGNVTKEELPLQERQLLKPISPYAVARVSQEMLSKVFVDSYQMDIIMTRSFNHIGLWQDDRFVVPSFLNKIMQIKKSGKSKGIIETGDISITRDFVDVRDVVRAYYLLLKQGKTGEIYNICSEKGVTLKEIILMIGNQVGVEVEAMEKTEFIRPTDNKILIGTAFKIYDELGWKAEISLNETIRDMIKDKVSINEKDYNEKKLKIV